MEPSAVRSPSSSLAGFVGDLGDFERGMKAEVDHVEIGGRGEADHGGGGEVVRGGIEFGVDHVAGDVEGRALTLCGGGEGEEQRDRQERAPVRSPDGDDEKPSQANGDRASLLPREILRIRCTLAGIQLSQSSLVLPPFGHRIVMPLGNSICFQGWCGCKGRLRNAARSLQQRWLRRVSMAPGTLAAGPRLTASATPREWPLTPFSWTREEAVG